MALWSDALIIAHKDIAEACWNYLKIKGLNNEACAAVLGNIERESHFSSTAIEGNGVGYGLIQWSNIRRTNLMNFAKKKNLDASNTNLQLDFLWEELTTTEGKTLTMLQNATDVSTAAISFEKLYERSGDSATTKQERVTYALFWYNQFKDNTVNTTSPLLNGIGEKKRAEDGASESAFFKYFDSDYLKISDELAVLMMDKLIKTDPLRRTDPLSKFDYISYGHRYYNTVYNLTIGDSSFTIPPQAISIVSDSSSQELVTLRQENSQKVKRGYSKRTITMELVFHGSEQINGYKVESPTGYYYVDGLRQLLAQFKCTPFLPISNHAINGMYNIHTVALQSIVCSTVEGFPDMVVANIVLQEVDLFPYIETHTMFFKDFIDWDLFRFYYQRQLTESHEYGKLQSIPTDKTLNKFKISILNEAIFNENIDYSSDNIVWYDKKWNLKGKKSSFSFYDVVLDKKIVYTDENGTIHVNDPSDEYPSNYNTYIDSEEDNVQIGAFQCGYSNMLTNIQMAEHSHPTIQYMGGMDTIFNITIETTDENIVTMLEQCSLSNNKLTRDHKDCASLGFVKLESELVELCGSRFVIIDNVTTSTVPEFPGLYVVQISCISFDVYQKENEGIHGLNPFPGDEANINGEGTKKNAITQSFKGLEDKIKQDIVVEQKLRTTTELYPDLKLPTYKEVDEIVKKIKDFRETHTNIEGEPLSSYVLDKYPRTPQQMLHGVNFNIENMQIDSNGFVTNVPEVLEMAGNYEGFVDPDFYVFYPDTYKDLVDNTAEEREKLGIDYTLPTPETRTTKISRTVYADEVTDSDISNYDYDLHTNGATELQVQFIAKARGKIGSTYSMQNRLGPNSYDCSGLISKCLMEMGVIKTSFTTRDISSYIKAGVFKQKWKVSSVNDINELTAHATPGDLLHIYGEERNTGQIGHIAIYTGNGNILHASSGKNQVCEIPAYKGFIRLLEIPALMKGNTSSQTIKQQTTKGSDVKTSSHTKVVSKSNSTCITKEELENVAKTIAKIQSGTRYNTQLALAQLIYDRFTDENSKYGNLNSILESAIFKGMVNTLPKSSTAYKAAKNVFCNGERVSDYRLINYLGLDSGNADYLNLDTKYTRISDTFDEFTFWTNKKKTSTLKYELVENETEKETTYGSTITEETEINTGVQEIEKAFVKYFGKPLLIRTDEMRKDGGWIAGLLSGKGHQNQESRYQDNYNTSFQTVMTSFVNQCEYSGKGRLVKAYPSYLFCIVDEDGNWLDGRKLWANYYVLRSLVDIQVASYNDSPVNTATVTVTNSYGNLDTLPPNSFYYSPLNDGEYNGIQKLLYKNFGILPGFGPKLTDTLVEQKNIIYDSMIIRAGSRMHLRMGYGSDPLSLPVVMNGYITDLSVGDITQFVCVSDGVELTNSVISDNPKDVNGIFESQESSNICIDLFTKRQSWLNKINNAWGEPNKFGIEHFGLYFSEHAEFIPTAEFGTGIIDVAEGVINFAGNTIETVFSAVANSWDGIFKSWKTMQYDLIKNIYRSSYDGSLAMYTPFKGFIDGEKNLCFSQYNKTPWDATQMATMNAPLYIGMPMYHQFESRFFLGLPWFLAKYRYDYINGEVYEEAKTFAQVHFVDSLTEIIDNQMTTSSRDVYTNSIVMYTLGKSPKASPTLYSDKSISFSQQSTKIFDSSVSQNLIGPDQLWEWMHMSMGKDGACRVGTSQLLWNWEKAYQGDVILIGDAGINPCDYIYLNDRFNSLTGLCTARTVLHSLSAKTGFITTVVPGMLGVDTNHRSQALVTITNIMTVGTAFSYFSSLKKAIKDNADACAAWYNHCEKMVNGLSVTMYANRAATTIMGLGLVVKNVKMTQQTISMIKGLKYAEAFAELRKMKSVITTTLNAGEAVSKMSKLGNLGKTAKGVFSLSKTSFKALGATGGSVGGVVGIALGFLAGLLLDILLTAVVDYFKYNNVLVLIPMMHNGNPYAPILSGEHLLLTGSSNTSNDTISDIVEGAPTEDNELGTETNMSSQNDEDYEFLAEQNESSPIV